MIQNDNPQTLVVTIDISDLQADLPMLGACTRSVQPQEDNMISLVDSSILASLQEKVVTTEQQVFLDQDVVYVQEEQVQAQEVPQNEVVIETVEEICSQDQVVEIELAQEEEANVEEENVAEENSDEMNFMSDDLASLISEDLDDELERAAKDAFNQNSLGPILKEELKTIIQHRRVKVGKEELKLGESRKRPAPAPAEETEDSLERKIRRRERNKVAAQRCRNRKKERTEELEEETAELVTRQASIKSDIEKLKEEKEMLMSMLRFHDASPAARCGRALSQSEEED